MEGPHPSDLDARSIPGRNLDGAYTAVLVRTEDRFQPDYHREEIPERWLSGKEGQVGVARKEPYARGAESIEMTLRAKRVGRIRRCTFLASTDQLWVTGLEQLTSTSWGRTLLISIFRPDPCDTARPYLSVYILLSRHITAHLV
jgi:hypothetical protein